MIFPIQKINELINSIKPFEGIMSIWGDFGVGKTTLALQTAINTAKSKKKALLIYTKPRIPDEKLRGFLGNVKEKDSESLVLLNVIDFNDLNRILFNLEFLILKSKQETESPLELIVIDSLTDLYRLELDRDKKEKNVRLNYILNQILATLTYINQNYGTKILIVNELSRVTEENITIETESGGKVMDYWIQYSLKINRTEVVGEREIVFSSMNEKGTKKFHCKLTENGFQ